jgi:hypothetical protein
MGKQQFTVRAQMFAAEIFQFEYFIQQFEQSHKIQCEDAGSLNLERTHSAVSRNEVTYSAFGKSEGLGVSNSFSSYKLHSCGSQ